MSPEDKLEDRLMFLRLQVKRLEREINEMRKTMNGLAHAVALLTNEKKTPLWVREYYRNWENQHKGWWNP